MLFPRLLLYGALRLRRVLRRVELEKHQGVREAECAIDEGVPLILFRVRRLGSVPVTEHIHRYPTEQLQDLKLRQPFREAPHPRNIRVMHVHDHM